MSQASTYLTGTRLKTLFSLRTPFRIPEEMRFEHLHLIAGSGHGKTQTIQYLISRDLPAVARGDKTVTAWPFEYHQPVWK